jgi:signal transduction histidine kinase/ActR/RegA family two-component response regulator
MRGRELDRRAGTSDSKDAPMSEPATPIAAPAIESVEDILHLLRTRVLLVALNVLAVTMPLVCAFLVVQASRAGALTPLTLALCSWGLVFPVLRVARSRWSFRTSALTLLAVLLVSVAIVALRGGLTVGNLAVSVLLILLAALFFGRRGAVLALVAVVSVIAVCGVLLVQGFVPPVSRELWDPLSAAVWVRQTFIMTLLGVVMAATELYVVERLAHQVEVHRNLAAREREQRLALERSEREREQAQRALEQSRRIEALARMAGGVAHDFNNALTVIIGGAELARLRRDSPEEVEECLSEVLRAAAGAADLSRRLLLLGRQHISKPRAVSIADLVSRLQASMRRILADDVQLVVAAPGEETNALVDEAGLERALLNLVINAGDAIGRAGTVTVGWRAMSVSDAPSLAAGRYVSISVSDTGQGMDRDTLDRIFDPFFTTKEDNGGTGLGLATVYAFTKESHGAVDATSAPGAGTTITLWLPEAIGVHPPTPAPLTPVPISVSPLPGTRVLVVEDRPDVRASMARILSHHGFEVSETSDGDGALRVLSHDTGFALMCIDGVMPGLETATVIERAQQLAPAMPVLVCSGHVQEELLRRGIATGRYAFLSKPFSAQQLLTSVANVLGPRGGTTVPLPPAQG